MAVITISRQYGSGGSDIARLVAQQLGWTLIDNEFVDRVAERAGITAEEVQQQEERVPSLIERVARALAVSMPEPPVELPPEDRIVRMTEAVIAEAVAQDHAVLVGRGAQAYLAERGSALHVYVVAPREARIDAAVRRLGVDRKAAEKAADETDAGRRRYVRTYYGREWDDAAAYDLVVNTAKLSFQQAADLIVEAARKRGLTSA